MISIPEDRKCRREWNPGCGEPVASGRRRWPFAWRTPGTNAHDGGYALFGGNLKDPNSKDVLLVPLVNTRDNSVKATGVPRIDVAGLQILPLAGAFQGGRFPHGAHGKAVEKAPCARSQARCHD